MKAIQVLRAGLEIERARFVAEYGLPAAMAELDAHFTISYRNRYHNGLGPNVYLAEIDHLDWISSDSCWRWWRRHDIAVTDDELDIMCTLMGVPEALLHLMIGEGFDNIRLKRTTIANFSPIWTQWFLDFRYANWQTVCSRPLSDLAG